MAAISSPNPINQAINSCAALPLPDTQIEKIQQVRKVIFSGEAKKYSKKELKIARSFLTSEDGKAVLLMTRKDGLLSEGGAVKAKVTVGIDLDSGEKVLVAVCKKEGCQGTEWEDLAHEETMMRMFQEIPQISQLYFTVRDKKDTRVYFVMKWYKEGDLFYNLARKSLPENDTIRIGLFRDWLLGLQKMHQDKVIHRDLKPENFFIDAGWKGVVGDLGHACSIGKATEEPKGTSGWNSPELANAISQNNGQLIKESATPEGDIFSMGCILFTLFVGYPFPFQIGKTEHQIRNQIRNVTDIQIADLLEIKNPKLHPEFKKGINKIPSEIKELIKEMTRKDPKDRSSLSEILEKFDLIMAARSNASPPEA